MTVFICCISCKISSQSNQHKWVKTHSGSDSINVPVLLINKKKFTKVKNLHFYNSVGGKSIVEETKIQMKYDENYLEIKFECRNNPRMNQNYYTKNNSPMFTQEVFEIFISNGVNSEENYIEIQLNPNNALYLAKIMNGYQSNKKFTNIPIDNKDAKVGHRVVKDEANATWSGYLQIPLWLIQYPEEISDTTFRMNMYRIISNEDHKLEKWKNNHENSTFACWSSTMSKRPQFHAPDYFGFLILD